MRGPGRLLVLVVAALGCSDPECDLDELIERDLDGVEAVDCGDHGENASENELYRALNCVLDAVEVGSPFRVTTVQGGFESTAASAYVGIRSQGESLELVKYSHTVSGLGEGFTARSTCEELGPFAVCDLGRLRNNLCLECGGDDQMIICEGDD